MAGKKGIPHPWNKTKKGTFVKGHIISSATRNKISKTRISRYTKKQLKEWSDYANSKNIPINKNTKIEIMMQEALILFNVDFITQHKVGKFTFDIFIPQYNLAIECDGDYWHQLPNNIKADKNKKRFCKDNDIRLIRFSETKIKTDMVGCLEKIPGVII